MRSHDFRCAARWLAAAAVSIAMAAAAAPPETFGPADPGAKEAGRFDARRPLARELELEAPEGLTVGAVGDLIISRPLSQYAASLPAFKAVLDVLQSNDALYGNLETTIFDPRAFAGAPYAWDGDWANSSQPSVARDLKSMGFGLVSRANNHSLDWGLEGMRETSRWLDQAGLAHAGIGEERGLARAPQYLETAKARIALVSIASTFRPTTDALPREGAAPGRPGLSALHVSRTIILPDKAMKALAEAGCVTEGRYCKELPESLELFDAKYRRGRTFGYEYTMDPEDLAEILKSVRAARENSDFVILAIHTHECSSACDDPDRPRGAGDFLKRLAHDAIDSGADLFVATGNHNLGAIEMYRSPARGVRPILYGLGNFFWSDVQEPLPHDLFQGNRALLARAWKDPAKATSYDLTAPLNKDSFAHEFTFHGVVAVSRFEGRQLAELRLYPVEEGYGERLTRSGIPRMVKDPKVAAAIFKEITDATQSFGLPALSVSVADAVAALKPAAESR